MALPSSHLTVKGRFPVGAGDLPYYDEARRMGISHKIAMKVAWELEEEQ